MPEEEEEQEIDNLLENIMENFPNLTKEIDFQEAQRVPKKLYARKHTSRHSIITFPNMKDERILKAARGKETVTLPRSSHKTIN